MKLLKFYADWCGPCKVLSKKLEGFDLCELVEVNIEEEENEYLVEKYLIRNIPTMILVNEEGEAIKKWTGLVDVEKVKSEINGIN